MSAAALRAPVGQATARPDAPGDRYAPRRPSPPPATPLLPPLVMRAVALAALCAFGATHWMLMVEPARGLRALAAVAICLGAAGALVASRRLTRRRRIAAVAATVLAGFVLALLAGGLPADDLRPSQWGAAAAAIGDGLGGLAGARVPYRGFDDGLRLVIGLGGTLLSLLLGLLAFWPHGGFALSPPRGRLPAQRLGFPAPALLAGVTLYAVPAVALILRAEFVRGAVLTLLVLLFWRGERLPRREAAAAAAVTAVAVVTALALAPILDRPAPWFDYEDWAQNAAGARSETFSWNHDYSALLWPRDGRELLRVKARQRAYWKAQTLDGFDGREWVVDDRFVPRGNGLSGVRGDRLRRWSQRIRVGVRNLRSSTLPVAGTAARVDFPQRTAGEQRPGVWSVGRQVHRGDAYEADVYVPQPSREEMQSAGTDYDESVRPATAFGVRSAPRTTRPPTAPPGNPPTMGLAFAPGFGQPLQGIVLGHREAGAALLEQSGLARTYRLSRRLLARAATPYEYVQAVQGHLDGPGFRYSEAPPIGSRTLDGFLFDTKAGFCQQYSGAMALLLRMGGVPARVVTGFAPGAYDRRRKEYVVRDLDAHSWVEASFPGIGWVTFDPTPSAAPPRSQAPADAPSAGSGDVGDLGGTPAPAQVAPAGATEGTGESRPPWVALAAGAGGLALLGLGVRALVRRRRRPHTPAIGELRRALRAADEPVAARLTLNQIEARLAASPDAAAYVRALRAQRFAPAAPLPTAAQRRGLRRALSRGRSPLVRARTWLALPPRLPRRRPA